MHIQIDFDMQDWIPDLVTAITVICSTLIFCMQLGFCFLEIGSSRSKNVSSMILKNYVATVLAFACFFVVGYALAFGKDVGGVFGISGFLLIGLEDYSGAFFQFTFLACSAIIISGAVAERTQLRGFVVVIMIYCLLVYPIQAHVIWYFNYLGTQTDF